MPRRHPDDAHPTSKLDPTRLYELRVISSLVDRVAVVATDTGEHPGLATDAMRPLARAPRRERRDESKRPRRSVIRMKALAK